MEKAYAQALWDIVESGTAVAVALESLHKHLALHGRTQLLPRIAYAFARLAEAHQKSSVITLSINSAGDESAARKACSEIVASLGAHAHDVQVQIDDTLIGGYRLEGRECLVDASYKKQLLSLYSQATNS